MDDERPTLPLKASEWTIAWTVSNELDEDVSSPPGRSKWWLIATHDAGDDGVTFVWARKRHAKNDDG